MIKRAVSPEELSALPERGIEAQKIRALLVAYGVKYDFCRFYVSEEHILCEMNGSFVVCDVRENSRFDELAGFFSFGGFSEIFCSEIAGDFLENALKCSCETVNLMRFVRKDGGFPKTELDRSPRLDEVFGILKTAFKLEYESWYADMSHRIRHGVSFAAKTDSSALIVQHSINGEALLSQIATRPEARGKGEAARLIRAVCSELCESEVYILCEDRLLGFYEKVGFERVGARSVLSHR